MLPVSVALVSGKGGVGKTMLTANLGVVLSKLGRRVTVLDADLHMANLLYFFDMKDVSMSLTDVLAGRADISEAVYEGPFGVRIVPTGIALSGMRGVDQRRLAGVLQNLLEGCDIVLVDGPGGLGVNALMAIAASQLCLLVTTPNVASLSDALKTKIVSERLGTRVVGVVVNRVVGDPGEVKVEEVGKLLELPVLGVIPEDPAVGASLSTGKPVVLENPRSGASMAIVRLAEKLVGGEKGGEGLVSDRMVARDTRSLLKRFLAAIRR